MLPVLRQVAVPEPQLPAQMTVAELKNQLAIITEAMHEVMVEGTDYGKIPGVDKPTLLKPGAEKLCVLFQFGGRPKVVRRTYDGAHLTVDAEYELFHIPSGRTVGVGVGSCSTKEAKYAWRKSGRACPSCGSAAISRSKYPVPQGAKENGWYCRNCKAQYPYKDPQITEQQTGRSANPDLADQWNTLTKMAKKRAKIDVTLDATGASAIFTQDVENFSHETPEDLVDSFQTEEEKKATTARRKPKATALLPQG